MSIVPRRKLARKVAPNVGQSPNGNVTRAHQTDKEGNQIRASVRNGYRRTDRASRGRTRLSSLMIAAGVNIKALQVFMGHASITVTMDRYGHLFKSEDHKRAMEAIAAEMLAFGM